MTFFAIATQSRMPGEAYLDVVNEPLFAVIIPQQPLCCAILLLGLSDVWL